MPEQPKATQRKKSFHVSFVTSAGKFDRQSATKFLTQNSTLLTGLEVSAKIVPELKIITFSGPSIIVNELKLHFKNDRMVTAQEVTARRALRQKQMTTGTTEHTERMIKELQERLKRAKDLSLNR